MTARIALAARHGVPWRALVLAALVSTLLGGALSHALLAGSGTSPAASPGSLTAASHKGLDSLSPAARASISGALGSDDPAYHFKAVAGGLEARNVAQHLGITANRARVLVRTGALELGLRLHAIGYGGSLHAVGAPAPVRAAANRITYPGAGVSGWYANGPLGLEQGFTVTRALERSTTAPLTLAISLSGNARASLAPGGRSVVFAAPDGNSLRYTGLSATDANGRALRSSLALEHGRLLLRVDAHDARFPLRIDPFVEEVAERELMPEGDEGQRAGLSVALSADGSTALVGGPKGAHMGGTVWVFTRTPSTLEYTQQEELTAHDAEGPNAPAGCNENQGGDEFEGCSFGSTLALSADGDTALIGDPHTSGVVDGETIEHAGAAFVFTRSGSKWSASATLTSAEPTTDGFFGRSVALAGDGETALIGAPGEEGDLGRAWLFTGSGTTWTQQGEPLSGESEKLEARFGRSVALSANGEVAVIGAPNEEQRRGAAYVFEDLAPAGLTLRVKLTGTDETSGTRFGFSVAVSGDGGAVLVGAPEAEASGGREDTGAVWAFARTGGEWPAQGEELTGLGAGGEQFGYSLALSDDGEAAVIGAPHGGPTPAGGSPPVGGSGDVWLYKHSAAGWGGPARKLVADLPEERREGGDEGKARFGASVASSGSASSEILLIGAPTVAGHDGAAWVVGNGPTITSLSPSSGPTAGGTEVTIEGQHFAGVTAVDFGSSEATIEAASEDAIVVLSPPGAGAVSITVTTPLGTSVPFEKFTYVAPTTETGGKRKENKSGSESSSSGNDQGSNQAGSGELDQASGQVLAAGPIVHACGATLLSKKILVEGRKLALFRLLGTGVGTCHGMLKLKVRVKVSAKRSVLRTIGTAVFSIKGGRRVVVNVKLTRAGRALLKAYHGHLSAKLLIVKSSPLPSLARIATVHLAPQPPKLKLEPKS
jgi:hypothetical protein